MNSEPNLGFLRGTKAYFDANVFIYRVEADPQWIEVLGELWQMLESGWLRAVTSELSLAESLIYPIRTKNHGAQSDFSRLISSKSNLLVLTVNRELLLEAARLRALHVLEMPDAIHAATTKIALCTHFLTADALLAQTIGACAVNFGTWKSRSISFCCEYYLFG